MPPERSRAQTARARWPVEGGRVFEWNPADPPLVQDAIGALKRNLRVMAPRRFDLEGKGRSSRIGRGCHNTRRAWLEQRWARRDRARHGPRRWTDNLSRTRIVAKTPSNRGRGHWNTAGTRSGPRRSFFSFVVAQTRRSGGASARKPMERRAGRGEGKRRGSRSNVHHGGSGDVEHDAGARPRTSRRQANTFAVERGFQRTFFLPPAGVQIRKRAAAWEPGAGGARKKTGSRW